MGMYEDYTKLVKDDYHIVFLCSNCNKEVILTRFSDGTIRILCPICKKKYLGKIEDGIVPFIKV